MYVTVTSSGAGIGDPDDCTSLDVRAGVDVVSSLDSALRLTQLGSWDGGNEADLNLAELRRRAEVGDVGADWPDRWEAMLEYARTRDWLAHDGSTVRAHVVIVPALADFRAGRRPP